MRYPTRGSEHDHRRPTAPPPPLRGLVATAVKCGRCRAPKCLDCGHQSMITDVLQPRLLPYAASLLPPSNAGDVARQNALTADIRAFGQTPTTRSRVTGDASPNPSGASGPVQTRNSSRDEASADQERGLMFIGAMTLHGDGCGDFSSDKLSAEGIALLVADGWWIGRDDRPIEDWPDILPVRKQLMLDALDLPKAERADVLGFATRFIRRHPELVRDAWGLRAVGNDIGVPDEVCEATRGDATLCGVYIFAELILAQLSDEGAVH